MSLTACQKIPFLVVCGSQIGIPDAAYLSRLWSSLTHDADLVHLKQGAQELSELWCLMVEKDRRLERISASASIRSLAEWAHSGDSTALWMELKSSTSRNTQLSVLTVLAHIVEYTSYLNLHEIRSGDASTGFEDAHDGLLQAVRDGGIQGLCIGMLSAAALACARTKADIVKNGAVAIRLAMCIGVYIDLDRMDTAEPMVSVAVRWPQGDETGEDVLKEAMETSDAYITVNMDTSSATVTAPKGSVPSLVSRFENKRGFVAKEIDLQGRFHSPAHQDSLERLCQLCDTLPMLQFPHGSIPQAPLRRNDNGELAQSNEDVSEGPSRLHEVVLRCILVEKADWYATMKSSSEAITQGCSRGGEEQPRALLLGPVDCVPHSLPLQVSRPWLPRCRNQQLYTYPDHAVAIVGASGRFPGAETLGEFWDMIKTKKSTDGTIPENRGYGKNGQCQQDGFRGNYLAKEGSFDHAFFRKSPREAAYMDPQHRLALHLAYEALESSGYFSPSSSETKAPEDVGCYIGVSSADYHDNVNVQPPTAFSFTGTARAFAPGRISHFFGWTGPSLAIDTACSSSMVAMHTAARAVQSGECSMALAGGLNLITSPRSHDNLGGASFLSPSGQCRPFDAAADGYCRGEGAGFVLLKRLSAAVADNDRILGVVVGSATNNSKGNASITVPSTESQSILYRSVLKTAGMQPSQVSYVEAHGTGTQKGDPVEYQSIRSVFGGAGGRRLRFGSVKGNIGHSESASGVASLLKSLLMLQHGQIPPQANLSVLNPALGSLEEADMEIPRQLQRWDEPFRAICVNNYGASGSNAVMIVCQPPPPKARDVRRLPATSPRYPFLIAAHSDAALQRYCRGLLQVTQTYEQQQEGSQLESTKAFLSKIAFNLAQKQNHTLQSRATFQAGSLSELKACLGMELQAAQTPQTPPRTRLPSRPVVLVFAGQTGHRPRLSREAYRLSVLLQRHLDRCDRVLQTLGLRSLFPHVFNGDEPIDDLADLHCMQFSIQYAAASAWIDAGLPVRKLVGHSLGQLTALCVSGAVSLRDGLRLVSGRAALIQTNWGPERGCMLSVDADIATVRSLLLTSTTTESAADGSSGSGNNSDDGGSDLETRLEIACYNSASNHIVVGSEAAIARLEDSTRSSKIRCTRLPVSHGFHSHMVDSIMEDFSELVRGIRFSSPRIELEPCANMPVSWADLTPEVVARQSREPVYFSNAVARVEATLGPACIWLEAGSGPIGVTMVRRALESQHGSTTCSGHSFHSIRLHVPEAIDSLAATTRNLWREGVRVQFWPFHSIQREDFGMLELPAYQFETSHHWVSIKSPVAKHEAPRQAVHQVEDLYRHLQPEDPEKSSKLVSFLGFQHGVHDDARGVTATFSINQHVDEYMALVQGRTVLGHTLAPSSVWLKSAGRALRLLFSSAEASNGSLQIDSVKLHGPFGLDPARVLRLTLRKQKPESATWNFEVESRSKTGPDTHPRLLASGRIRLEMKDDHTEASRFGPHGRMLHRLIDHKQCVGIRRDPEASVVQGTFVRKLLGRVAIYTPESFGITSIATRDIEAVARVSLPPATAFAPGNEKVDAVHPLVHDNFLLVAEMHATNLEACPDDELYICNSLDAVFPGDLSDGPWTVYSKLHHGEGTKNSAISDIFVFNDLSGALELVILGANFRRTRMSSFKQALSEMQGGGRGSASTSRDFEHDIHKEKFPFNLKLDACHPEDNSSNSDQDSGIGLTGASQLESKAQFPWSAAASHAERQEVSTPSISVDTADNPITSIKSTVMDLVSDITACVPGTSMDDTTCLSDLGVDSLSATELQARLKEVFLVDFPLRRRLENESLTLGSLCQEIWSSMNGPPNSLAASTLSQNSVSNTIKSWPHPQAQVPAPPSKKDSEQSESERESISRLSRLLAENLDFRTETPLDHQAPLGDMGLDSLVAIQLKSDIQEVFGKAIGGNLRLDPETTFEDLCNALLGHSPTEIVTTEGITTKSPSPSLDSANAPSCLSTALQPPSRLSVIVKEAPAELQRVNESYGSLAHEVGWADFYASGAHQEQSTLVLAYITEAFAALGCDLASLEAGDQLPSMTCLPKYQKLVARYHDILTEARLIEPSPTCNGLGFRRTSTPLQAHQRASELHASIMRALPAFSPEHQLLHVTAPHLADCLSGRTDPLELLFSDRAARQLLTDVYVKSPLFASGNRVLGEFIRRLLPHRQNQRTSSSSSSSSGRAEPLRILEIGGGTGGTTHLVLAELLAAGADFEYTFTDISAGLVASTKRAFTVRYGEAVTGAHMRWTVLDLEAPPPPSLESRYDVVLSANCVHATRDLAASCARARALLRPEGGLLCLVELTRPRGWLDCVFGLLDGWWRFGDGRAYALADERRWEGVLRGAGFFHVGWSGDRSRESEQIRLITALGCGE